MVGTGPYRLVSYDPENRVVMQANEHFWGEDLTKLAGVEEAVTGYMEDIRALGMRAAMEKTFNA